MKNNRTKSGFCLIGFILFFLFISPSFYAQTVSYLGTNVGIGSSTPGVNLDVQGTIRSTSYINALSLVSTTSPSAVSSFTISGLNPNVKYLLMIDLTQNTSAGYKTVTFNSDTSSNYRWNDYTMASSGNSNTYNSTGDTSFNLDGHNVTTATYPFHSEVNFSTQPGNDNNVIVSYKSTSQSSFPQVFESIGGAVYAGVSPLSTITITTNAGTMTGTVKLYAYN